MRQTQPSRQIRQNFRIVLLLLAALGAGAAAVDAEASSRSMKKFGFYASTAGDPFISLLGFNVGYNLFDFLSLHGGFGSIPTGFVNGSSMGVGGRLLVPGWNLSPSIGVSASSAKVDFMGLVALENQFFVSTQVGLDWQTGYGLFLAVGATLPTQTMTSALPYFHLGWFF